MNTKFRLQKHFKKWIWLLLLFSLTAMASFAQENLIKIQGIVSAKDGPVAGVTISIKNGKVLGTSDEKGKFKFDVAEATTLVFKYLGFKEKEVILKEYRPDAKGHYILDVLLETTQESALDEVVVVGFGTQKKASLVSSIASVNPKELKGPTSNLTTMLAGRIPGMIAYQRSGEPGADNASFFVRGLGSFGSGKTDPLILIDGVESTQTDLARLQPDDIASFSVLKDATAAAVYGARGANGVLLITTKVGTSGKTQFMARAEGKISTNSRNIELTDNITYMNLANEAVLTRGLSKPTPYTQSKIENTIRHTNPYLYPDNDWIDMLIKDYTFNQGFNLSASGGGERARFYVSGTYNVDNGVLKKLGTNNFNNNIKLINYSLRSNVDLQLTKSTQASVKLYGQFDDYNGPIGSGADHFRAALWSNPVQFPAVYPKEYMPYIQHPLFGGSVVIDDTAPQGVLLTNPYANLVRGYQQYNRSTLMPQVEIKQNLDFLTKGLNFRMMGYAKRYSYGQTARSYNPFYYTGRLDPSDNSILLSVINDGSTGSVGTPGQEFLSYGTSGSDINSTLYFEASTNYARTFGKHDISAMLITLFQDYKISRDNITTLQLGLPKRNNGISGRFTYGYDNRYLAEFNFGYNGSERFHESNRFGFFPSFGLAYRVSNEPFFKSLSSVVSDFKLRATYGIIGNDAIGSDSDRFFYLSQVNIGDTNFGSTFGEDYGYYRPGVSVSRYANHQISWEQSRQINLGLDLSFLNNSIGLIADFYKDYKSHILESRSYIGSTIGLQATPMANTGKAEKRGFDLALTYNKNLSTGWSFQYRGNVTFAQSKITKRDELLYPDNMNYRYQVGHSVAQSFGLIAERLFIDEYDVANAPAQQFGDYMAGDIKYRDMNGDELITDNDAVPIGYPTSPELIYGFGGTTGYKGFDFSFFFQGSGKSSFFINPENITPFVRNGGAQNGLLAAIANDYWSEENRNIYAFFPRLSDYFVNNNNRQSTWWMRNGEFLRLKNIELGYNLSRSLADHYKLKSLRLYFNMMNVFTLSNFKMWDVEMGGNGLGYPIQRTYNFGIQVNF
ncbi:TonB-dependent receptor [Sphingobacterium sp.]|uniref:SusC/RagA family TonB-linked outer membrane protein n=1 Tax=Sphingobacterium sp. TaxID=341027 RepID=UPI0028AB495D|nr:TonB-dependent receptor [Sphingobacterium sp.]